MGSTLGRMMDEDAGVVGLADATTASTMTAIVQRCYGRPDVLESTAVDKPVVGDDDVLVLGRDGETSSMANASRTGQGHEWSVHSVVVRVRDGPERVRAAYRLLLDAESMSTDGCASLVQGRLMQVAIYTRVLTERQEREQTIESQLAVLRAWIEANGHTLAPEHVFLDEGYSGARLDRPGLDRLRDAVQDGECGCRRGAQS